MIDRTALFQTLYASVAVNTADGKAPPPPAPSPRDGFTSTTTALSAEIALLADQVRLFRLDHARSSMMNSVSQSGAAISTGAERLKRKFDEIEAALKVTSQSLKTSSGRTSQGKQHAERVLMSLEQRLAQIMKDFQDSLQKRAKSLADRQERQKSLFGEAASYRYARPVAAPNPGASMAPSVPSLATSPFPRPNGQPYQPRPMMTGMSAAAPPQQNPNLRYRAPAQPLFIQPTQQPQFDHGNGNDDDDDDGKSGNRQMLIRKRDRLETSKSRLRDVERVERTIGELSQMFLRVAGMVKEQGEIIDDIESLVDDTQTNTTQAQAELLKLFRFISSDRALIIKILAVTLFLGLVVIYFWT